MKKCLYIVALFLFFNQLSAQDNHELYGIWLKRAAFGSSGTASIESSIIDESNNIYLAGSFRGTLNFSDDLCNAEKYTAINFASGSAFVAKFDQAGKFIWFVQLNPNISTGCSTSPQLTLLDYKKGKLLLQCRIQFNSSTTYGSYIGYQMISGSQKVNLNKNTKDGFSYSSSDCNPNTSSFVFILNALQLINVETAALSEPIDIYTLGTSRTSATRFLSDDVIGSDHWGASSFYNQMSIFTRYTISTKKASNMSYPYQYYKPDYMESRANGLQAQLNSFVLNHSVIINPKSTLPMTEIFFLLRYTTTFAACINSRKDIDYRVNVTYNLQKDDSDNIYFFCNYGNKTDNYRAPLNDRNRLINFMGTGDNFYTRNGYNKLLIVKLNPDLTNNTQNGTKAVIQIGANDQNNSDIVEGKNIYTYGNYTYVIGRFKGVNINFDPLNSNSEWKLSSTNNSYDAFYAVYNNADWRCVYAAKMFGELDDENTIIDVVSKDIVLVGGNYNSKIFDGDPSKRLFPLSSNGTKQGFVGLYSSNPNSTASKYHISFGDAPLNYGIAVHDVFPCLSLGSYDFDKALNSPVYSIDANSQFSDDAITIIETSDHFTDLTSDGFKLDDSGNLNVKVRVNNSSGEIANLMGWIDFNHNGIFDADEASTLVKVQSSFTKDVIYTITWTNSISKMRNGVTYLRVRLTTDALTPNQSIGAFFNGDIEDYKLNFNLFEISKRATITKTNLDKLKDPFVEIGDFIDYKIKLKSKYNSKLKLFDVIPNYTKFVSSTPQGTQGTVTIQGLSKDAIIWDNLTLLANKEYNYSFRAKVTSLPKTPGTYISNIAFAVMSGDSVPSVGANCNTNPIFINSIQANNDKIMGILNRTITSDVLMNDTLGTCKLGKLSDFDVIPGYEPKNGILIINKATDSTFSYTPNKDYWGIDSVSYYIKCSTDSSAAKVYCLTNNPLALEYYACNRAAVLLGFEAAKDITYDWYTAEKAGTLIKANSPSLQVIKGKTTAGTDKDIGVWWVEPSFNGIKFPRYKIVLEQSFSCGGSNVVECIENGSLLFKEDFGGTLSDPWASLTGIGNKTNLNFVAPPPGLDGYSIIKEGRDWSAVYPLWVTKSKDHTLPSFDETGFYFFLANINPPLSISNPIDFKKQFYQCSISDLCEGTKLYFSAWLMNYNDAVQYAASTKPNLIFELWSGSVKIATYFTGDITVEQDAQWKQYGFPFTVPKGVKDIELRIFNYLEKGYPVAVALDDIEVRFCAPKVFITQPTNDEMSLCPDESINFSGNYIDDSSLGNSLEAYWIYSKTGNIDTPSDWTIISDTKVTSTTGDIISNYIITSVHENDEGYYRLVVGNPVSINKPNCRAASKIIHLRVYNGLKNYPDIRVQSCVKMGEINLSGYLDTVDFKSVIWSRVVAPSEGFDVNGKVNTDYFTSFNIYIYEYTIQNSCVTSKAKLYLNTRYTDIVKTLPDKLVFCYENAEALQLNQIFGIEAKGKFAYDAALNPYIKTAVAPLVYAGATTFNGKDAYNNLDNSFIYPYSGDNNAKKITINYVINDPKSCLNGKTISLDIILTSDIIE